MKKISFIAIALIGFAALASAKVTPESGGWPFIVINNTDYKLAVDDLYSDHLNHGTFWKKNSFTVNPKQSFVWKERAEVQRIGGSRPKKSMFTLEIYDTPQELDWKSMMNRIRNMIIPGAAETVYVDVAGQESVGKTYEVTPFKDRDAAAKKTKTKQIVITVDWTGAAYKIIVDQYEVPSGYTEPGGEGGNEEPEGNYIWGSSNVTR